MGQLFTMTKVLFRNVDKIDPEYFLVNSHLVLNQELSLKDLAHNFKNFQSRKDVLAQIMRTKGFSKTNFEENTNHFTTDIIDGFCGAIVGPPANEKGMAIS